MHGGLGLDHTLYRPFVDPLASRYTLIFFDHRGNGRSPRPGDATMLTHEQWVEDAEVLRQTLGYDRWLMGGDSYGGVLAQEYAVCHADRLAGLVLCSTAPVYSHMEAAMGRMQQRGTPEQVQAFLDVVEHPVTTDAELERAVYAVMPMYLSTPSDALLANLFGDVIYSAAAFNRAFMELLPRFDVREPLRSVQVPTLVISGEDDWQCPPQDGIDPFRPLLANMRAEAFADCGHYIYAEQPERFRSTLLDWMQSIPGYEAAGD